MSSSEIKHLLVDKIYDIDDVEYLKAIKKILDTHQAGKAVFEMSADQRAAVLEGQQQIREGKFISNDALEQEEDKWLKE